MANHQNFEGVLFIEAQVITGTPFSISTRQQTVMNYFSSFPKFCSISAQNIEGSSLCPQIAFNFILQENPFFLPGLFPFLFDSQCAWE